MMSIEYILSLAKSVGRQAARVSLQPRTFFDRADFNENWRDIPNLGNYRATRHGWKLIEYRTVDKTGLGHDNEPALSVGQFKNWIMGYLGKNAGWAIIEEGQFQVVIGRFERKNWDRTFS